MRPICVTKTIDGEWTARFEDAMSCVRGATWQEALDAFCADRDVDRGALVMMEFETRPTPRYRFEMPHLRAG